MVTTYIRQCERFHMQCLRMLNASASDDIVDGLLLTSTVRPRDIGAYV